MGNEECSIPLSMRVKSIRSIWFSHLFSFFLHFSCALRCFAGYKPRVLSMWLYDATRKGTRNSREWMSEYGWMNEYVWHENQFGWRKVKPVGTGTGTGTDAQCDWIWREWECVLNIVCTAMMVRLLGVLFPPCSCEAFQASELGWKSGIREEEASASVCSTTVAHSLRYVNGWFSSLWQCE